MDLLRGLVAKGIRHLFTWKPTGTTAKAKKDISNPNPSSNCQPTQCQQKGQSSILGTKDELSKLEKRFQKWTALLRRHEKLAGTRVKAGDLRRQLLKEQQHLSILLGNLSKLLSESRCGLDKQPLPNTESAIKEVLEYIQTIQTQEESLGAIDEDIIQQEYQVELLLPRIPGPKYREMTLKMLNKYGFDIPAEGSDSGSSDSRDLGKEITGYEDYPTVQAYLQKLKKISELEDQLIALQLERQRAWDERDHERELYGHTNEGEIDHDADGYEELDGREQEYEELVRSLELAQTELEEFRNDSEDLET